MGTRDPRIDTYIARAQEFARPILAHLREVVHDACPEVEETIKWSMPSFEYHGILCDMAAFRRHAAFGFWKHGLVVGAEDGRWKEAMGSFGRLTTLRDLPTKADLKRMIRVAMRLNEEGVTAPRRKRGPRRVVAMPAELRAALARDDRAKRAFDSFSPSHKREYMEWIGEAKQQATRARRTAQAIQWLAAGKHRNWKYEKR